MYENFDDYAWTGQSHNIEKSIIFYHQSEKGAEAKVAYLISETNDEYDEVIYDYDVIKLEQ